MQKTIDEAINETADKLIHVINDSGLPLSVIKLILTNLQYQISNIQQQAPAPTTEEAKDAKN